MITDASLCISTQLPIGQSVQVVHMRVVCVRALRVRDLASVDTAEQTVKGTDNLFSMYLELAPAGTMRRELPALTELHACHACLDSCST
jgi:hypothetical protein